MYNTRATLFYQQIENGNIANQIHGFTIDYGKFILISVGMRTLIGQVSQPNFTLHTTIIKSSLVSQFATGKHCSCTKFLTTQSHDFGRE